MARIDQILHLSTGHLTAETADFLHDSLGGDGPAIVSGFVRECGFVVYTDPDHLLSSTSDTQMPEDLRYALQYGQAHICAWIMFDRDEEPVTDLPLYEW